MTSKAGQTTSIRSEQVAAIKASCFIDQDGIRILYCSLFWADISYCSEMCGTTYGANIRCMTVLHKWVVRLVLGVSRVENAGTLFKQLSILTFVN